MALMYYNSVCFGIVDLESVLCEIPHHESSLAVSNPVVDIKSLNEDDQEDLECVINELRRKIHIEFHKLINVILKSWNSRKIDFEELFLTVKNENVFEEGDLDRVKTVHDVLLMVKSRCSYFNHEVFQTMIEVHGSDQDKTYLQRYKEEFTVYCKAVPCIECVDYGNGNESKRTKLGFKVDFELKDLKQNVVKSIQHNIARHLGIRPSSLYLQRVTDGCVLLEFLVPNFVVEKIFPLTDSQIVALYSEDKVLTIESEAFKLVRRSFINYAMHCMNMAVIVTVMIIIVQDIQSHASRLLQASQLQTTDSGKLCTYFAAPSPMTMS